MSAHPEALLISAMLRTQDYKTVTAAGINSSLFSAFKAEMEWIEKYYAKHGNLPSRISVKNKFPDMPWYKTNDVAHFCHEVKEEYARSSMTELLDTAVELLMAGKIDKAVNRLGTELLSIQAAVADDPGDYDVAGDYNDTLLDVCDRVERVKRLGRAGVPTGFPTLDDVTGGYQPGWWVIIAARLGQGKTYTMVRNAAAAALAGYSVQYWSLEQSRHQIAMRLHSFLASEYGFEVFKSNDLMKGTGFDLRSYKKFLEQMSDKLDGRIIINDTTRGRVSPLTVAGGIERTDPDIAFIDYITLMQMEGQGDWRSIGRLSADMKQIAERYQVPVVGASQINRAGEGKEPPGTGNLSQADSLGHDADLVITMSRKSRRVMKLKIAKNRHGEDGVMWYCKFSPGTGEYTEITGDEADEIVSQDNDAD